MNHAREDAATFIAEYEYDVEQGRRLSVDASAEAVNVLERAVNCIDHQAARIRELEGALENTVRLLADVAENPHTGTTTRQVMREHAAHARRILAEGGAS